MTQVWAQTALWPELALIATLWRNWPRRRAGGTGRLRKNRGSARCPCPNC